MTSESDVNTSTIAIIGFVGAVVVFAVIVLLAIVFYRVQSEEEFVKDVSQTYERVSQLEADQRGKLASYGWVDQKRQIARVPVRWAMDLVSTELAQDPNASVIGVPPPEQPAPGGSQEKPKEKGKEKEKPKEKTEPKEKEKSDAP
jgi:hypothetical protein